MTTEASKMGDGYTPGEWVIDFDDASNDNNYFPCWIIYGFGGKAYVGEARREDDARLIAAAPDLLKACKAYLEAYELTGTRQCVCREEGGLGMCDLCRERYDAAAELAKAAIKKAEAGDS